MKTGTRYFLVRRLVSKLRFSVLRMERNTGIKFHQTKTFGNFLAKNEMVIIKCGFSRPNIIIDCSKYGHGMCDNARKAQYHAQ